MFFSYGCSIAVIPPDFLVFIFVLFRVFNHLFGIMVSTYDAIQEVPGSIPGYTKEFCSGNMGTGKCQPSLVRSIG